MFAVSGEGTSTFTIVITGDPVTLNNAGFSMTATGFVINPPSPAALVGGNLNINVGATLTLSAGQALGTYLSTTPFTVTVLYN